MNRTIVALATQSALGVPMVATFEQPPAGQVWIVSRLSVEIPNYAAGGVAASAFAQLPAGSVPAVVTIDDVFVCGTDQGQGDAAGGPFIVGAGQKLAVTWNPTRTLGNVQGKAVAWIVAAPAAELYRSTVGLAGSGGFGNPLSAGLLGTGTAPLYSGPFGAANVGPIDVSAFESLTVQAVPQNVGDAVRFEIQWRDLNNNVLNPDTLPQGFPPPVMTGLAAVDTVGDLLVNVPVLGPSVQFLVASHVGGVTLVVWGRSLQWGGHIRTPGAEGATLLATAPALLIGQNVATAIPAIYAGPVRVAAKGSGGVPFSISLETVTGARLLSGVESNNPPAGNLGVLSWAADTAWLPPEPCQLRIINGGTAQTVTAAVNATAPSA